jgi:hypothetical protein
MDSLGGLEEKQQMMETSKMMQTTNKRQTVLSRFTSGERKELTKEMRIMQYYQQYHRKWNQQNDKIKKEIFQASPTLLERSKK